MSSRPNVLLLMTDDQALSDMGAMPKTMAFFKENGTEFKRAISNYPLCCPARSTVLTGQQAHNHGVMSNKSPVGAFPKLNDRETLPVWLSRAGYQTIMLGKYLQEYPTPGHETYVPPGWSIWQVPIIGPYHYDSYTMNQNGVPHKYKEYQTDFMAHRMTELIEDANKDSKPWFMWASFLAPHGGTPEEPDDPRTIKKSLNAADTPAVADKYRDTFKGKFTNLAPSLNETDMSDKSRFMQSLPRQDVNDMAEVVAQRRESLRSVDDAVEGVLNTLRRLRVAKNTIIIFVSDNGFLTGEHRWNHKILGYEESIRVPMLIAGPGFPAKQQREQLVNMADLTASIVKAAGATARLEQDGIALQDLAQDPSLYSRRAQLLEAADWPVPSAKRVYNGIRTANDLVLLRWYDGTEEFYDLRSDPWQLDGRVSDAERKWLPEMRNGLNQLSTCKGASCNSVAIGD